MKGFIENIFDASKHQQRAIDIEKKIKEQRDQRKGEMVQAMYEVVCDPNNKKAYYESVWYENTLKNDSLLNDLKFRKALNIPKLKS